MAAGPSWRTRGLEMIDDEGDVYLSRSAAWRDDERFAVELRASWEQQYADYLGVSVARALVAELEAGGKLLHDNDPAPWVASIDARPVGIAALEPLGALSLITMLEVIPIHRGRGIGSRLLHALIAEAPGLVAHVSIHRPRVLDLYVRNGFSVLKREQVDHDGHLLTFDVVARLK